MQLPIVLFFMIIMLLMFPSISLRGLTQLSIRKPSRRLLTSVKLSDSIYSEQLKPFRYSFPDIDSATWKSLEHFCQLIVEWNEKVNLISRKDIDEIAVRHLLPSMTISKFKKFECDEKVIDIGCGGGFPGLPLAIINKHSQFTLLDSNSKKMMIVRDVADKLKLENVRVLTSRAEDCHETFDTLLGRAVSAIPNFLSFSSHLQKINSTSGLWYLKGGDFVQELKDAKVKSYQLHPVSGEVPIESDKFVLHIPATEIIAFHERMSTKTVINPKKKTATNGARNSPERR